MCLWPNMKCVLNLNVFHNSKSQCIIPAPMRQIRTQPPKNDKWHVTFLCDIRSLKLPSAPDKEGTSCNSHQDDSQACRTTSIPQSQGRSTSLEAKEISHESTHFNYNCLCSVRIYYVIKLTKYISIHILSIHFSNNYVSLIVQSIALTLKAITVHSCVTPAPPWA